VSAGRVGLSDRASDAEALVALPSGLAILIRSVVADRDLYVAAEPVAEVPVKFSRLRAAFITC
jgi:hypothetical protein